MPLGPFVPWSCPPIWRVLMVATLSSTNSLFSDESIFRTGVAEPLPTKLEGDDMSALTVPQLVEQIIQINKTASAAYLHQFARSELRHYLEHLVNAQRPRGRDAIWIRREASAGILAADPLD